MLIRILCVALCLSAVDLQAQTRHLVLGNGASPWAESGELQALDAEAAPGWIQPTRTTLAYNILHQLYASGQLYYGSSPGLWRGYRPGQDGRIWSPNVPGGQNDDLLMLADGIEDTLSFRYFNRVLSNDGVAFFVDLGIPYPVSRISFYPLDLGYHQDMYMKGYELLASDGSPAQTDAAGNPVYMLLSAVPDNDQRAVVDSSFVPQHLRYVQLKSTSGQAFELDQIEINGEGFVRVASFTSRIVDLGDIGNIGRIFWSAEQDPGSSLQVQTRVGRDLTTRVYYSINELGEPEALDGATDEINKAAYDRLPSAARGAIVDDTENWTLWSVPYDAVGQAVATDGPGRYLQVRLTLETETASARTRVDSVAVEYSQPVMARSVAAQVMPRQDVALGQTQSFTYQVVADVGAGDTGFDTIELDMPHWSGLQRVMLGGREIPVQALTVETSKDLLRLQLMEDRIHGADDVLELTFETTILVYGTVIGGRVWPSWRPELLPQQIVPGREGEMTVLGAAASLGRVLGRARSVPRVFSPNGDGANEITYVEFQVSQVIGSAPLQVRVFDLSGRPIVTLMDDAPAESDNFRVAWNGLDASQKLVPPGLYLFEVRLRGDNGEVVRHGTVGVAY
jgi:hypothetical protein